jgi:hypothetical protein
MSDPSGLSEFSEFNTYLGAGSTVAGGTCFVGGLVSGGTGWVACGAIATTFGVTSVLAWGFEEIFG